LSGNVYSTSHPIGRFFCCYGNRMADGIPPGSFAAALRPAQGETSSTLTQPPVAVKLRVHVKISRVEYEG
jgi:hypothetical protein